MCLRIPGLLFLSLVALTGCDGSNQLRTENNALKQQIQSMSAEIAQLKQQTPQADRELQTFEDMYVACQVAHPKWRYLGNQ